MSVVGRLDARDGRWYVDPLDPELRYSSVTTVLSAATNKPWLVDWSAKVAALYVAANLDELVEVHAVKGPGAVVDLVKREAKRLRELKAELGTHQHNVLEALLLDAPIPEVPEHLIGAEVDGERVDHDAVSDGLLAFIADFDLRPQMAEAVVVSETFGYAGTLDLTGIFPGLRRIPRYDELPTNPLGLIDCKTGRYLDPYMRAQLGAYLRAEVVWGALGQRWEMPRCDFAGVLHLRREYRRGYKLIPIQTDQASFDWFLQCQRVLEHQRAQDKIGRAAVYPPLPDGDQPPPYLEDVEHEGFKFRGVLLKHGIESLTDLAAYTRTELLALPGLGPKRLDVVTELLALHQLALAEVPADPAAPAPIPTPRGDL